VTSVVKLAVLWYDSAERKLRPRFLASFLPRYFRSTIQRLKEFIIERTIPILMENNFYQETAAQINKAQIELQIRLEQVSKLKSEYSESFLNPLRRTSLIESD